MPYLTATSAGRQKRQLGEPLDQSVTPCACCFVVTADNKYIMACGYWDNSFKCFLVDSGKKFAINRNVRACALIKLLGTELFGVFGQNIRPVRACYRLCTILPWDDVALCSL